MFKKLAILIMLGASSAFAQISQSAVIDAVKANPALLNTPQAKAEMAKYGVSKSTVLSKKKQSSNKTSQTNANSVSKSPINKIAAVKHTAVPTRAAQTSSSGSSVYIDPFAYTSNRSLLHALKAKQLIKKSLRLQRYGISFFKNRNNINTASLPVPDYYVLSYGDVVSLWIYGTTNNHFSLKINNNGDIDIPQYGPLHVAGMRFEKLSSFLKQKLKKVYPNTKLAVNIASYATIQVNLTGDVTAPGVYNVNALSSVKNLLIVAHGVKPNGSLRDVLVKRGGKVIATIDFYRLLQDGDSGFNVVLQPNDTVYVPKAKKLVSIFGQVNDPAIFELKPNNTLLNLLKYAGGLKANSSKYGFVVERYINHSKLKTLNVSLSDAKSFKLLNGDKVYVYAISQAKKDSIYIYGNVVRPGAVAIGDYKTLGALLNHEIAKRTMQGVFLKHTLFTYALLKETTPSLGTKVKSFSLANVLKHTKIIKLHSGDKFYIFNKYNSNIVPYVSIKNYSASNPVITKPGKYRFYNNMTIKDLINVAGRYSKIDYVSVISYHVNSLMPKTIMLHGNQVFSYKLQPYDKVVVYNYYKFHPIHSFVIYGQINVPNSYPINKNMTLQDAIQVAGGFTQKAYKQNIEVVRYYIKNNERKVHIIEVPYAKINTFKLHNFDDIHVHKIPNWGHTKVVTIKGQVMFPGTYVIHTGERLASVLKRAGGFTNNAFLRGAVFTRASIKKLQRQRLQQSLLTLKQKALALSASPKSFGQKGSKTNLIAITDMIDKMSKEAQNLGPIGRISIKLQRNIARFALSKSNIVLKNHDTLNVPSPNNTVLIVGQVMSPTAVVYASNNANYYIKQAGGLTSRADNDHMYVIHANGSAQKLDTGWFSNENIIRAGDTIIVPQELITYSGLQMTKDIASIFYQFALTTASLHVIGVL